MRTHTMPDGFVLTVEQNPKAIVSPPEIKTGNRTVLLAPLQIGENYWLLRVKVSERQAVLLFPKFMQYGIGFALEEDWNTNLSAGAPADIILAHIVKNKGDDAIPDDRVQQAIQMLKESIVELTGNPKYGTDPEQEQEMRALTEELKARGLA